MRTLPICLALLCVSGLVTACDTGSPLPVTEIGNPERNLGVAATAPPLTEPTGEPVIERAWASLGEIKLELDEQFAGEDELEWETPTVTTDLAAGPAQVRFRSPIAAYNRVTLRPREGRDMPADAPDELEDYSFIIEGTRADGVPFELRSTTEEDIELVGAFELERDQTQLALGFDLDLWFDADALAAAEVVGGVITIDGRSNTSLLRAFEDALPASVSFAEDLDGDGQVGDVDLILLD